MKSRNDRNEEQLIKEMVELHRQITNLKAKEDIGKRVEEAFQEQEHFLKNIFESIQDGISVLDTDMTIIRVNPTMEKWYSHMMPLVGKKCYEAYHCSAKPCEVCPSRKTIKSGKSAYEVVPKTGPKGEVTGWLDLYSFPFLDSATGQIKGVIEYVRDITEQKKVEGKLSESEYRFKTIFDKATDGLLLVDTETTRFVLCNPIMPQMLGYSAEELMHMSVKDIHPEAARASAEEQFKKMTKKELEIACDIPVQKKDGSIFYADISSSLVEMENKKYILGSFRDNTERKKIVDELQKHREHLEELVRGRTAELEEEAAERENAERDAENLRKQIEFILGATKTGLDIIDEEYNIVYIDPEWEKVYGDHAGKKCYEYFMDRDAACLGCGIKKAFETKDIVITEEILAKEGNRPIQVTTIPFQTKAGRWLVAEVNVDISERKKAEEELKKYRDRLEELVKKRTSHLLAEIAEHSETEHQREKLTAELVKSNKQLKRLTLVDSHTGLYNHRYLEEAIERELYRARRYGNPLSVMMMDIDYFKSINDVYGHQFGDLVLKQFAKLIRSMVRRYDIIVRFGGEEFIIVSPGATGATALSLGQRILDAINLHRFGNKKHVIKLKVSIAVSSYPESDTAKGMDLIDIADQILNKVKEYGGNKVYTIEDAKIKKHTPLRKESERADVKILKTKIDRLNKRASQSLVEAIFAFAKTIELKDHYTGEHGERTVHYATEIAKNMKLPPDEIERVREAAILHDLGKIGISEKILLKKGPLTKREFEAIKKHPQIGVDIIRPIQFLHSIIPLMFYHHERWDGKGYPMGLKGKEIPIGARIIAIADAFQALSSDRPYRKAYPIDEAVKMIEKGSGSQFDAFVVEAFLEVMKKNNKPGK